MRHVIITAGSKGLGLKVTERFLKQGYSVTLSYHKDRTGVDSLCQNWNKDRLQCVQADVTQEKDLLNLVHKAMEQFNRIDCLINNAGPYIFARKPLMDYTPEEWKLMIDGNLNSVFYLLKAVVPVMRSQGFGRIINYGFQDAGHATGWKYRAAFAAAKVGLASLTRSLSLEEAPYGITVNMICPGVILDDMKERDIKDARIHGDGITPLGRSATGEDVARLITFLCDEHSEMITGSVIDVTGGIDAVHRYSQQ